MWTNGERRPPATWLEAASSLDALFSDGLPEAAEIAGEDDVFLAGGSFAAARAP